MKYILTFLLIGAATSVHAQVDTEALPKVDDGFEINFFVKEPHIINPSALCFDRRGRLYVGAGPQYRHPKEDSPTDYIKILIDNDGDGVAETVKTFAEGLNSVQSMAWKGNELWVANSPELTVLRDTNGDDVADEYQVIYTGLNNLRHGLHGLNWGPDGWLYMTMGNEWLSPNAPKPFRDLHGHKSDDTTVYPLTKIYTKDTYPKSYISMKKAEKEGGIFRCRPAGHDLELYARGMRNPWDMCMDSGFNWLATDNDNGPESDRIFMPIRHGHYGFRHPWKLDWKGVHQAVAPSSELFPRVSGSGTGVVYYTDSHFPENYRNRYLIADWTNNCIYLYTPKWDGALQVPAEKMRKIVESSGGYGDLSWKGKQGISLFRPTDMEIGPDGAVYIAGWGSVYGTEYVPKEKWTAEENAKYQGRVFRLRHKSPLIAREKWDGPKRKKDIAAWTPAELLEDLGTPVHVWRVDAQDELIRRGKAVRNDLLKAVTTGGLNEMQSTWAIWAVARIDSASGSDMKYMADLAGKGSDLNLRIQATRILGENKVSDAAVILVGLLSDPEPRIRLAAIQSLDQVGWGSHTKIILDTVANEKDRLVSYTAWQVLRRQMPVAERRKLLKDERFVVRRMAALGFMEEGDRPMQKRSDQYLKEFPDSDVMEIAPPKILVEQRNFRELTKIRFESVSGTEVRYTTDGTEPTSKSAQAKGEIVIKENTTIKAAAFSGGKKVSETTSATANKITDAEWKDRLFVMGIRGKGKANSYQAESEGLQRGVTAYADRNDTFTEIPDALSGSTIIRTYNEDKNGSESDFLRFDINVPATLYLAYDERVAPPKALVETMKKTDMTVRISGGEKFAVYSKEVPAGEVVLGGNKVGGSGAGAMYMLFLNKAGAGKTTAGAVIPLLAKADPKRGEQIFFGSGTCFACHQVNGKGVTIGPDLVGINKLRDAAYVVQSILEPDAYIVEGFQQTSLEMKDGRKLFGMILEETGQELTITLPTGERVKVTPEEIKKREDAEHSGMPASFAHTLSPQDVADMTAWIMQLKDK